MKTARTTIGIISIVLFVMVAFQSCAAGMGNALENNGSHSGSMGMGLAFFLLIAGIVGIVGRSSKVPAIVASMFYFLAAICGATNVGIFKDLKIWSAVCLIFGLFFLISGILQKKTPKSSDASEKKQTQ